MDDTLDPFDPPQEHGLSRPWRVAFSLVGAALAPALLAAAFLTYALTSLPDPSPAAYSLAEHIFLLASLFGILFFYALVIAGAHTLFLGLPAYLIGNLTGRIRWWSCLLLSFLIGALPSAFFPGSPDFTDTIRSPDGRNMIAALGVLGATGGLTFWLLWRFWIDRHPALRP